MQHSSKHLTTFMSKQMTDLLMECHERELLGLPPFDVSTHELKPLLRRGYVQCCVYKNHAKEYLSGCITGEGKKFLANFTSENSAETSKIVVKDYTATSIAGSCNEKQITGHQPITEPAGSKKILLSASHIDFLMKCYYRELTGLTPAYASNKYVKALADSKYLIRHTYRKDNRKIIKCVLISNEGKNFIKLVKVFSNYLLFH